MEATTPAVATAFRLIGIGSCDAVAAMRERVDATSVEGLMLAADAAWCRGEPCAAECALRAAHASAAARDRPYVVDALAWLLAVCGRYARAAALLDAPSADRTLEAGRLALRALVHAAHGDAARSLREAAAARDELRSVPDETARVRVAVRLAHAAYVRRDAADALAAVETGLRAARSAAAPRAAASMHAVAYAVHLRLRGDAGGAWRHAVELERTAELACDATLRRLANAALCELAAERGDVHRAQLACAAAGHVRSGRTGFGPALGSVLGAARDGDLAGARACAAELDGSVARTPGERAMARALVALLAVACGDPAAARRASRRAISMSAHPGRRLLAGDVRRLRLGRALASVAGELAGDAARARRAASARFVRGDAGAAALWDRRETPDAFPVAVRGYGALVCAARRSALERPPSGPLTPAESEIVRALAAGVTVAQIAARTARSTHTVRTHLRNASAKLDAHGRADVIARARATGAF